jgi:outer membrane protein assembly factor BamB
VGDLLVVGSCNGMLRALDKKTGHVKWEYDIRQDGEQSQFHGDPLVTGQSLVIGTDGKIGHVYAFDRATGAVRWKYRVDDRGVATDVILLAENVYFVTRGNQLVCLDLATGAVKWSFRSSYAGAEDCLMCSSPAAAEGQVYFGGLDGFAYALEARSGKLVWKRDLGAQVTTSAALRGHDLYLGTAKRHLYRLNTDSGEVLSDLATEATPNGHLVVADNSLLAFLGDEIIASVDLGLAKLQWSAEASKEWTSARPYFWKDVVLAGNRHELIALRSGDGARIWSHQFPETVRGIGTSLDVLYVGTLRGPVFAYAPKP